MTPPNPASSRSSCPVAWSTGLATRLAAKSTLCRGSVWLLMGTVLAIVAAHEFAVMLILALLPPLPDWQEGIVDAVLLTLLASPALWFVTRIVARRLESAERSRLAARLGAILGASADGIIMTDGEGRIMSFNDGAERIFGYAEHELLGRSINVLVPPALAARHAELMLAFCQGTESKRDAGSRGVLEARDKDGRRIPVEVSIAKAEVEGETTLIAIVRDVSAHERSDAELRLAREQAETANRAKSEFLANMSHEIRTPMNAIIGLSDLMLDTPLNDEQRNFVETIHTSGDALLGVINDILDLSKIESGHMTLETAPFEIRQCVDMAVDLVAARAAQKRLDLVQEVEESTPHRLFGDATRLRQIIVNLVGNAVKFTETGEVLVQVRCLALSDDKAEVQFSVRDTGIGMTAEEQQRLFRPFTQADASTTRRFGGTGLGLAISRSFVEMMGGQFQVQSQPGAGSTFSFSVSLPVAETASAGAASAESPPLLSGRRLLVVDDNSTNRRILLHQVERWGARAIPCASPRSALAAVACGETFDLALLDLHMPDMDGGELARRIREQLGNATPPLLLLSSLGTRLPAEVRERFAGVLNKPIKSALLRAAVEGALGGCGQTANPSQANGERSLATRHPLRILLADDNTVNRHVATSMLERLGYRITVVCDGEEALEVASRIEFDLIFMDMQMPRMDGLAATRRLRLLESDGHNRTFIVAMTANVSREDRRACELAGMDDFLPKPAHLTDLQTIILRAANRHTKRYPLLGKTSGSD